MSYITKSVLANMLYFFNWSVDKVTNLTLISTIKNIFRIAVVKHAQKQALYIKFLVISKFLLIVM